jgi:hypothetical protein
MEAFQELAKELKIEMWMSAMTHRGVPSNENGIPEHIAKLSSAISVIVQMADSSDGVHLSLLKDHDNPNVAKLTLDLDPATMLLVQK